MPDFKGRKDFPEVADAKIKIGDYSGNNRLAVTDIYSPKAEPELRDQIMESRKGKPNNYDSPGLSQQPVITLSDMDAEAALIRAIGGYVEKQAVQKLGKDGMPVPQGELKPAGGGAGGFDAAPEKKPTWDGAPKFDVGDPRDRRGGANPNTGGDAPPQNVNAGKSPIAGTGGTRSASTALGRTPSPAPKSRKLGDFRPPGEESKKPVAGRYDNIGRKPTPSRMTPPPTKDGRVVDRGRVPANKQVVDVKYGPSAGDVDSNTGRKRKGGGFLGRLGGAAAKFGREGVEGVARMGADATGAGVKAFQQNYGFGNRRGRSQNKEQFYYSDEMALSDILNELDSYIANEQPNNAMVEQQLTKGNISKMMRNTEEKAPRDWKYHV